MTLEVLDHLFGPLIPTTYKSSSISGVNAAHRTPTAAYYTILESRTHVGWPRKNGFWFRSSYQKCVGKEKFEFLGLCGQISNFLTLFFKCAPKFVKWPQNEKKKSQLKMSEFFLCGCSLTKKIGLFNILNPGQRREGTSSYSKGCKKKRFKVVAL